MTNCGGEAELLGGIEAGGTKFICAVGRSPDDLVETFRIDTRGPQETLSACAAFFSRFPGLRALGICSFGPLDLMRDSPTFGAILRTPKLGWAGVNLIREFQSRLRIPVALETDVNGAALAEHQWGAAQGLNDFLYLTVGTGIGGGAIAGGELVHGRMHPEMGHISVRRAEEDPYQGGCPYHLDCLEGLASGPAISARWGKAPAALPGDHPAWKLEAYYLAQALKNYSCILAPQKIIMGGGVMAQTKLLTLVREQTRLLLNGYLAGLDNDLTGYIVAPGLGDRCGILGGLALAEKIKPFPDSRREY